MSASDQQQAPDFYFASPPSQQQTPPPQPLQTPPQPKPDPPKKQSKAGMIAALMVVVVLALGAAGGIVYLLNRPAATPQPAAHLLTLFYNDGKTVYWQSGDITKWHEANVAGFPGQVIEELKGHVRSDDLQEGTWEVTTTLNKSLQSAAEQQVQAKQDTFKRDGVEGLAMIAQDVTTGQIVSWVDRLDTSGAATDRVTAKTEVATLAMPFTYAAYADAIPGTTPETTFDDSIGALPGYPCTNRALPTAGGNCLFNRDGTFMGKMTMRQALGQGRFVPAVRAAAQVGGPLGETTKIQTFMENLTVAGKFACYSDASLNDKSESVCYTAAALGDGLYGTPKDVIEAYATLATGGKKLPQVSILKANGGGKVAYEWTRPTAQQTMKAETAQMINAILTDAEASSIKQKGLFALDGTKIGIVLGTEAENRLASVVQLSPRYAVGLWAFAGTRDVQEGPEGLVLPLTAAWMQAAE